MSAIPAFVVVGHARFQDMGPNRVAEFKINGKTM
jgi:hypothetical protein